MGATIRAQYLQGKRIYITIKATWSSKSSKAMALPVDLAEMLFRPAPSPKGSSYIFVANKHTARDAIRLIASTPGGLP